MFISFLRCCEKYFPLHHFFLVFDFNICHIFMFQTIKYSLILQSAVFKWWFNLLTKKPSLTKPTLYEKNGMTLREYISNRIIRCPWQPKKIQTSLHIILVCIFLCSWKAQSSLNVWKQTSIHNIKQELHSLLFCFFLLLRIKRNL